MFASENLHLAWAVQRLAHAARIGGHQWGDVGSKLRALLFYMTFIV
jgi:hypothetical protein